MTPAEKLSKSLNAPRDVRPARARRGPVACTMTERRQALGLSLRDVSGAVKMSVSSLHRLECGEASPRLTTALALGKFFGCEILELWPQRRAK